MPSVEASIEIKAVIRISFVNVPSIPDQNPPGGYTGVAYQYQVVATGGYPPLHFAFDPSLPAPDGFTISDSGLIEGIQETSGNVDFAIIVKDSRV